MRGPLPGQDKHLPPHSGVTMGEMRQCCKIFPAMVLLALIASIVRAFTESA